MISFLPSRRSARRKRAEHAADMREIIVAEMAGHGNDRGVAGISGVFVIEQHTSCHRLQCFTGSQDRITERRSRKNAEHQLFDRQIVRIIVAHADFLKDNAALSFDA